MQPDQRFSPRKPLRARGTLTMEGMPAQQVSTIDLSPGGMGIGLSKQLFPGQRCAIYFDLFRNGRNSHIKAVAKIAYCVCGGNVGFKAGLQFLDIDEASSAAINEFLK